MTLRTWIGLSLTRWSSIKMYSEKSEGVDGLTLPKESQDPGGGMRHW